MKTYRISLTVERGANRAYRVEALNGSRWSNPLPNALEPSRDIQSAIDVCYTILDNWRGEDVASRDYRDLAGAMRERIEEISPRLPLSIDEFGLSAALANHREWEGILADR